MRVERYRASSCTSMAATGRRRNVDEERCQSGSSGTLQEKRAASCFNALEYSRTARRRRSEEHTSELQSHHDLVCRLVLEKKNISSRFAYVAAPPDFSYPYLVRR